MNTTMLIAIAILSGIGMLAVDNYFQKKEDSFFNLFLNFINWAVCLFIFLIIAS